MKSITATALLIASLLASPSARANELTETWLGTYSSTQTNFLTMKRLTVSKEKDGSIKLRGWLVGFPEEVFIGEAKAEAYADKNNKTTPDIVLAKFSSEKFSPFLVISPSSSDGKHFMFMNLQCFLKDTDGTKIHFNAQLKREDQP